MCLSTVYKVVNGKNEKIGEYISSVKIENGKIFISDIMGAVKEIAGNISYIDLVKNEITIEK